MKKLSFLSAISGMYDAMKGVSRCTDAACHVYTIGARFIFIALIFLLAPPQAWAQTFSGGNGSETSPFVITTAAQLAQLAQLVNDGDTDFNDKHYRLENDIDLSAYAAGAGWTPIGGYVTTTLDRPFKGVFDGNNKRITGLKIDLEVNYSLVIYSGLFGLVDGGTVKDLNVENFEITVSNRSNLCVGGVAGYVRGGGVLFNCFSSGTLNATSITSSYAGGIAGSMDDSAITFCLSSATVNSNATNSTAFAGGIVGVLSGGVISDCHATGKVTALSVGQSIVGGLLGRFGSTSNIENCSATGVVSATNTSTIGGGMRVGGLIGNVTTSSVVSKCFSTGEVNATAASGSIFAGGIVGEFAAGAKINNSYSTGAVNATNTSYGSVYIGGVTGSITASGDVSNCYATGAINVSAAGTETRVGGITGTGNPVYSNAALNPSITREASGTIFGRITGDFLNEQNNIAFADMINPEGGTTWSIGPYDFKNGSDITIEAIHADGTLGGRFTAENGWTTANGRLPGFGSTVAMPPHLRLPGSITPYPEIDYPFLTLATKTPETVTEDDKVEVNLGATIETFTGKGHSFVAEAGATYQITGEFASAGMYRIFVMGDDLQGVMTQDELASYSSNGASLASGSFAPAVSDTYRILVVNESTGAFAYDITVAEQTNDCTHILAQGKVGEYIDWFLCADGTLTITGEGEMSNYSLQASPFYAHRQYITTAIIDDGVTSIGRNVFAYLSNLTSVSIGSGVTLIDFQAFTNSGLTSVTIPEGVTEAGTSAFGHCADLEIVYFNAVNLKDFAGSSTPFNDCTSLATVVFGDKVERIPRSILIGVSKLTDVTIGSSVSSIGREAFSQSGIASVVIPGNVKTIEYQAFANCTKLESVVMEHGVEEIGQGAFQSCAILTTLEIPASVTTIIYNAFSGCTSLSEIINYATTPQTLSGSMFTSVPKTTCLLRVPAGSIELYRAATEWTDFLNIVGDIEITLPDNAQTPTITAHPQGAEYDRNAQAAPLSVTATVTDGGTPSYQWYSNSANSNSDGTAIAGATDVTYTPSTATVGTLYYYVVVTNTIIAVDGAKTAAATSNTATVTIKADAPTNVEALSFAELKIYPNPFLGEVRIVGAVAVETRHATSLQMQIINAAGAIVHTQTITNDDETINLEHLPSGVYFFRFEKDGKTQTERVVKE